MKFIEKNKNFYNLQKSLEDLDLEKKYLVDFAVLDFLQSEMRM